MLNEKCVDYFVCRRTTADYDRMSAIYQFCDSNFGPSRHYENWAISWAGSATDDWARFSFYNAEYAVFAKMTFSDLLLTEEQWLDLEFQNINLAY